MYAVKTNKYSHANSAAEREASCHHGLEDAKNAADECASTRRFGRVVDVQTGVELYRGVKRTAEKRFRNSTVARYDLRTLPAGLVCRKSEGETRDDAPRWGSETPPPKNRRSCADQL